MSWSGKVYCTCFQKGRWPEPPVPASVLAVTGAGQVVLAPGEEEYATVFQTWRNHACTVCGHMSQLAAYETFYYSPWTSFVKAVGHSKWPLLPSLIEQVEATGDSVTPLESIEALLKQLRAFRACPEVDLLPGVVDARARALLPLDEYTSLALRVWLKNGANGTGEIQIEKKGRLVFASSHLEISRRPHKGFTYRDLQPDSPWGEVFCSRSLLKDMGKEPRAIEVVPFAQRGGNYTEVLDPLERLFQVALEMGHPIVWC